MATMRNRHTTRYESYGNVAYAPQAGGAVAAPRPEQEDYTTALPRRRVKEKVAPQTLTRTKVQVREAGEIAPVGIVAFGLAGVLAVMLLCSFVQNMLISAELVNLQNEYAAVEVEHAALSAQYERIFDIASIEAAVEGKMVRPSPDQVVYLDLSQPDAVNVFGGDAKVGGVAGLFAGMQEIVTDLVEYFGNDQHIVDESTTR